MSQPIDHKPHAWVQGVIDANKGIHQTTDLPQRANPGVKMFMWPSVESIMGLRPWIYPRGLRRCVSRRAVLPLLFLCMCIAVTGIPLCHVYIRTATQAMFPQSGDFNEVSIKNSRMIMRYAWYVSFRYVSPLSVPSIENIWRGKVWLKLWLCKLWLCIYVEM